MRFGLVLLVASVVGAGCLGAGPDETHSDGSLPALPTLALVGPFVVDAEKAGAEPVVAVAPDGTLFAEGVGAGNVVWRSLDGGVSWTDVSPPATGSVDSNDGFVEVGPDGVVFAANVFELTFQVFRSADRGASWEPLNMPRIPALMHRHWIVAHEAGVLHVSVEALEPGASPVLVGGPTATEGVLGSPNQGHYYMRSSDNGDTWSTPVRMDEQIVYAGQSNLAVTGDDQGIYMVRYEEDQGPPLDYTYDDGRFYLVASEDGGASWERREMFPLGGLIGSALTSLVADARGTLYYVWSEALAGRSVTHLAASKDRGESWTRTPLNLTDGTHAMPFAAPLGPAELGIVFYNTTDVGVTGEVDGPWYVSYAHVRGADGPSPTWETVLVSDVVHEDDICVKGPACGAEGGNRRLLDYPWVDVDGEGAAHLIFASTMWDFGGAQPIYSRVEPTHVTSSS